MTKRELLKELESISMDEKIYVQEYCHRNEQEFFYPVNGVIREVAKKVSKQKYERNINGKEQTEITVIY